MRGDDEHLQPTHKQDADETRPSIFKTLGLPATYPIGRLTDTTPPIDPTLAELQKQTLLLQQLVDHIKSL